MLLRPLLGLAFGCIYLVATYALATQQADHAPAFDSIREIDLRTDVAVLTSDDMQGRRTDTKGNRRATTFIAKRFERLDLTPAANGHYSMPFDLIAPRLESRENNTLITRTRTDVTIASFVLGDDYFPQRFSPSASAEGGVVFAGFGITATSIDHDDYAESDATGKVVLLLTHEPGEYDPQSKFDGLAPTEHARLVRKAIEAERRGAVAVLFTSDTHNHNRSSSLNSAMDRAWPLVERRRPRYELGSWVAQLTIPAMHISTTVAEQLVADSGTSWSTLVAEAESEEFLPVELPVTVSATTDVSREQVTINNVVGLLRGTNSTAPDEWVVVSAHLDHEGIIGNQTYRGADDNASGVAGLLEVADAFVSAAREGHRPKRSILFATWNAEELGLLGSWAYTENPLTPLEDTVAVINLDMIGRDEEIPPQGGPRFRGLPPQAADSNHNAVNILGYSHSTDLREAVERANLINLDVRFRYDDNPSNLLRRSDQWPFLARGVPALFIHTGLHPDYHTDRDVANKLNYGKMTRIVQLAYQLSWDLANAPNRPALD